ncbi:hypothetical protein ACED96_12550 [Clostridium thermobutyricum]|uniref:Beta-1,6-galactofuranosyltransferase WbbI n=1 Tax=Clostridium thermobutyricum DSM 4928 TaxID=1121339 RepID=A0A1V4SZZ3_9CLOT|nr:hypothetical protein [Clostridium thermobutyricum]OPX50382.1 beta-1,6-galactofuranosyltransferase WbbI [Clostridium thermobutyricum DSM 4928]
MNMIYFLKDYQEENFNALSKARLDAEKIMIKNGCKELNFYLGGRKIYYKSFFKRRNEKKKLKSGDTLLIQYPYYFKYWGSFFNTIQELRSNGIKVVALIHDIICLRPYEKPITMNDEVKVFNQLDGIISHNEHMTKLLVQSGVKVPIYNLDIFDYLSDKFDMEIVDDFKNINIAGNLVIDKAKYIYLKELDDVKTKISLYGVGFEKEKVLNNKNNLDYIGCFKPEELGKHMKTGFGLIWDGESLDKCSGMMGEYLKVNNPHKTSMYLSIGMPVIVWNKSAMKDLVLENNIGIAIDSLKEIDKTLENITFEKYKEMAENCRKFGEKLRNGYFLGKAIEKIK